MARTREPDIEFDPRHRIVGAVVLVTLAVILLPLILDEHPESRLVNGNPPHQDTPEQTVAAAENGAVKTEKVVIRKLDLGERSVSATDKAEAPQNTASKASAPTQVVTKKIDITAPPANDSKQSPTPVATTKSTQAVTKAHWAVQVGTFSNQANVRRLKKQLEQHGFPVMFKDIQLKQGNAVRVRVGPFTTRASADKAQGKIRQDIGIKGVVVAGP